MNVEVTYQPNWRLEIWGDDLPSRPAWFVTCPEHPDLGKNNDGTPWGYATSGRAHSVASRHARTKHAVGTATSQDRPAGG